MGVAPARQVVDSLRSYSTRTGVTSAATLRTQLAAELRTLLVEPPPFELKGDPTVVLLVGVNGAGKTTTAAKLAQLARTVYGARPLLAACDTFRAAAVEQLQTWGARLDVPVVAGAAGADPGAVLFDAVAGQNALVQAAAFKAAVGVSAIVITKLDSSARGGIVFAVQQALGLPVQFVGTGERLEDLQTFNPDNYVAQLLAEESQR